ncbi:hypothetical protein [Empedobacter brevis]|uniref:hypothetical protein n=1 Tax=Empedobacter brevis TaxID=247 RepID=UPI002FE1A93E
MKAGTYLTAWVFSTMILYTVLLAYLYFADLFSHEMVVLNGYFTDTYLIVYTGCFAVFWLMAAGLFRKRKMVYPLLLAGYVLFFVKGVNTFLWEYLAGMTGATYLPGELFLEYALSQWLFYVLLLAGGTGIFSIARIIFFNEV